MLKARSHNIVRSSQPAHLELHLVVVLARMQRVEVRDAVDAEHHSLTVNDELLLSVLQRRLDDPGEALRPVMAGPGDQPHGFALALDAQAVAVIFDFVNPVGTSRHGLCRRGQAELERFQHGQQIGCGTAFWSLPA